MKIGLYSDPHITKKMGNLQSEWEKSILDTFTSMYYVFKQERVSAVVCGGDFFDKSTLEANSVDLVNKVLSIMNDSQLTTYILSGNHEMDSLGVSVLDYFKDHPRVKVVTRPTTIVDNGDESIFTMLPYSNQMEEYIEYLEKVDSPYLITHADIVGASLAAGKSISNFGYDPKYFKKFTAIFNGHIHTRSRVDNIINIGSVLTSQQGEIRYGEYPQFYVVDLSLSEVNIKEVENRDSLLFYSVDYNRYVLLEDNFDLSKLVLRVDCDEEQYKSLSETESPVLRQTLRKTISGDSIEVKGEIVRSVVDLRESMSRYIANDSSVPRDSKDRILNLALSFLN